MASTRSSSNSYLSACLPVCPSVFPRAHSRARARACVCGCVRTLQKSERGLCRCVRKSFVVSRYAFVCVLRNYLYLSTYLPTYLPTFLFVILFRRIVGLYHAKQERKMYVRVYRLPFAPPRRRVCIVTRRYSIFIDRERKGINLNTFLKFKHASENRRDSTTM